MRLTERSSEDSEVSGVEMLSLLWSNSGFFHNVESESNQELQISLSSPLVYKCT